MRESERNALKEKGKIYAYLHKWLEDNQDIEISDNEKPSERIGRWLYAYRKKGKYPKSIDKGGKWLIFEDTSSIDTAWEKVKKATEDGLLGYSSKVSSRLPNQITNTDHVICVYTHDYTDKADKLRIRAELEKCGFERILRYKAHTSPTGLDDEVILSL